MKASEYIFSEAKSFVKNFPETRVRYEHDFVAHTHFVEIISNHLENKYLQWESDFFDRFIAQYPDENICFLSNGAIVGLDKVDFELHGAEFIEIGSVQEFFKQSKLKKNVRRHEKVFC